MRIIVAGQPKTGNNWYKSLFAALYGLPVLHGVEGGTVAHIQSYIDAGKLKVNGVLHGHFPPEGALLEVLDQTHGHIVTPLRNPYDAFVSLYFFVNNHKASVENENDPLAMMAGKPIDHPAVFDYLVDPAGYETHLALSLAWIESGRSILSRYEHLYVDPVREVNRLAERIQPAHPDLVQQAIAAASPEETRKKGDYWRVHVRSGKVGDWRKHLTARHLEVMRNQYGDMIHRIGYRVW